MKMTKWMERKLSELGKITTGKTPPSSQPKFYGGNIPFVTPSDMDIRRTIDTTARYLTNAGALNVKSSFIDKPAICVSCIGSDMGKAVLVDQPFVSNQQINSIVVYEYVERLFVYYNLLGRKDEIRFKASGAAQPIMNKSDFGRLTLRIPDQPTQKRIAKVLGSLDDKIELNRQMNETLEEMARALFRDWFIDFGPTRRQMDGATDPAAIMGHAFPDNKAATLAPLFPARLGENGLPEGWKTLPLSEFCSVKSGKRPPNKEKDQTDDNLIPVWGGNGVSWFTNQPLFSERMIITGRVGTLGTVYRVFGDVWVSDNALCIFPDKNCFEFLFQSMKIFNYSALNNGSTQPLLTQGTLKEQLCINSGGDLRSSFQEIAHNFTNKIRLNAKENKTLAQIRDLLLPKLMSGEIQLKDAPMVQDTLDRQPIESPQLGTRKNLFLKSTK